MRDVHCHILPGVDDGARSIEESIEMVQAAMRVGVTAITCTPHCRDPWFDYRAMRGAFQLLQREVQKVPNAPKLSMGFEVNYKKLVELGEGWIDRLACETGDFLLELPTSHLPDDWERQVFRIQGRGYRVIIAHPERYAAVQEDVGVARAFIEVGCRIQVSANFCARSALNAVRKTAKRLFECDLVHHVASDAHDASAYRMLADVRKEFRACGAHARL